MDEKDIKYCFIDNHLKNFEELIKGIKLRIYAIEIPVFTNTDGVKYADIVLEWMSTRVHKIIKPLY